jgi:hypothetical protein
MALDVLDVNEDNGKTGLQLPPLLEKEKEKDTEMPIVKNVKENKSKMKTLLFPDI